MNRLRDTWRRAVTAELCWTNPDGSPAAIAVTPMLRGTDHAASTLCAALPYSRAQEIEGLREAGAAVFAVTDSRSLPDGAVAGVAAAGAVRIIDDLEGELFTEELLEQDLLKYPPSRTLADSVLLRRENWWWLPRIVVEFTGPAVGAGEPDGMRLPARTNPARHGLLVTVAAGARESPDTAESPGASESPSALEPTNTRVRSRVPELHGVDLEGRADLEGRVDLGARVGSAPAAATPAEPAPLRTPAGEPLSSAPGAALVFGYDYTMPDLERWESWSLAGKTDGLRLAVDARDGTPGGELRTLGLLARTRRHRALAKACRSGLRAAQYRARPAS